MIVSKETNDPPRTQEELFNLASKHFRNAWIALGVDGWCDAANGAEYQRIEQEWAAAFRPFDVWYFIREAANRRPPAKAPRKESIS